MQPAVLTIAGSDSSGGAGIQADLKTILQHQCYGASVITALTAQNIDGVFGIYPVSDDFFAKQLDVTLSGMRFDAIKIGMLHRPGIIDIIIHAIKKYQLKNIVVDPVLFATSQDSLFQDEVIQHMYPLFLVADLITPNIPEAIALYPSQRQKFQHDKYQLSDLENGDSRMIIHLMQALAIEISQSYHVSVLLKGGHATSADATDVLLQYPCQTKNLFTEKRINHVNAHGTGCTLSSAIAANLARGMTITNSTLQAKRYITKLLKWNNKKEKSLDNIPLFHHLVSA